MALPLREGESNDTVDDLASRNKKTSIKERKWWILTPIDEAVVILLICLVAIPFFLEHDRSYAFRAAICIIVQIDLTQRADSSLEKFLYVEIGVEDWSKFE